jgi:hypothetical protein
MEAMDSASEVHCAVLIRGSSGVPWYATPAAESALYQSAYSLRYAPLMKNCWPFAKNLAPLTEIAGIAAMAGSIKLARHASCDRKDSMLMLVSSKAKMMRSEISPMRSIMMWIIWSICRGMQMLMLLFNSDGELGRKKVDFGERLQSTITDHSFFPTM